MAKKKYWQSFSQLNDSDAHKKLSENEFQEKLPLEDLDDGKSIVPASRRDFLKYVGFSTAAAMVAASCEIPVRKAIPYANKPQDMVPGVADYYATTYISGGEAVPILAKVRDGRPIKIEGNTTSSITKGNTTARVQASVLDLYDTARLRQPMANGTAVSAEAADKQISEALAGLGGAPIVLLTSTITSPTTKAIITDFLAKYPGSRHVQFDAISYSGMLLANEACYGKRTIPGYDFGKADVIVSLGADFLGTWLNPVEFSKQYVAGRKIDVKDPKMSRHFQFESTMSMTGANADERAVHRPSESGVVAAALLSAVNGQGAMGVQGKLKEAIEKAAKELVAARGKALVVSGSNNKDVQVIVNAINEAIGANGTTINWSTPILMAQGIDSEMVSLVADMNAGKVGALMIYGVNPAYEYFDAEKFAAGLKKVKVVVSMNDRMDETTELCKYIIPAPHFLESWGDAEPKAGYYSMIQPTINPLFHTRPFQDTLLKWTGSTDTYDNYVKNFWESRLGGLEAFEKALQDGVIEPAMGDSLISTTSFNSASVTAAVAAASALKKTSGAEIVIYQKVGMGDGKQANNPWLLEMPDPITKATWDNYAIISPQMAKELEIKLDDDYEVFPKKPVVSFKIGNQSVELPILAIPGMQANTIAVAVGYGRSPKVGRAVVSSEGPTYGKNAYPFLSYNGSTVDWTGVVAEYKKTDAEYKIAQTQTHGSYEGRAEVVREVTLSEFKENPTVIWDDRNEELKAFGGIGNFKDDGSPYPTYEKPGIEWGMSIDLNACFGCGACVVACHAENNVPMVGKNEVLRFHDMHWLRIDRYFSGDPNDPDSIQTVFQPMMCQHCDNAPCENVCPVAATHHSDEGINMMVYNRCIGTKYCANNCPYKVRRFNWADYMGGDSFADNQDFSGVGKLDDSVLMMNDDLTRMVLNPDVVVRSRGVMEKCSMCVQRAQAGKLKAKKEGRPLEDSDAQTACQQACASDAIVFGNAKNPDSIVSKSRVDNRLRVYYTLEELHTLPNVNYLAKVRNTDKLTGVKEEEHSEKGEAAPVDHVESHS